jgi:uncharacterized protein (DUF697 family)
MSCHKIIIKSAIAAGGAGAPGAFVPGIDIAAISSIWTNMVTCIARETGRKIDNNTVLKFIGAIASGSAAYIGGSKAINWLLNLIPGVGTIAAVGLNCAFNFVYTFRLGKQVAKEFEKSTFDADSLLYFGKSIMKIVFAVPTVSELKEAFNYLSE